MTVILNNGVKLKLQKDVSTQLIDLMIKSPDGWNFILSKDHVPILILNSKEVSAIVREENIDII